MERGRCAACGEAFRPRLQVSKQSYCQRGALSACAQATLARLSRSSVVSMMGWIDPYVWHLHWLRARYLA
jgi:hypothetical protein